MLDNFGNHSSDFSANLGTPRWMVSFADLLSLILTFFVLIFAMSNPGKDIAEENKNFDHQSEAAFSLEQNKTPTNIELARTDESLSTNYLYDIMQEKIAPHPELLAMNISPLPDRMVMSFGKGEFNDKMANSLAVILKTIQNKTEIYSAELATSHMIAEKLQQNGLKREISFYEATRPEGKIDIIIYP